MRERDRRRPPLANLAARPGAKLSGQTRRERAAKKDICNRIRIEFRIAYERSRARRNEWLGLRRISRCLVARLDNDSGSASARRKRGESSKKIRTRISYQSQCPPGRHGEIAPARLRTRRCSPDGARRGPEVQHSRSGCANAKGSARTVYCKMAAIQKRKPARSGVRSKENEHDGL